MSLHWCVNSAHDEICLYISTAKWVHILRTWANQRHEVPSSGAGQAAVRSWLPVPALHCSGALISPPYASTPSTRFVSVPVSHVSVISQSSREHLCLTLMKDSSNLLPSAFSDSVFSTLSKVTWLITPQSCFITCASVYGNSSSLPCYTDWTFSPTFPVLLSSVPLSSAASLPTTPSANPPRTQAGPFLTPALYQEPLWASRAFSKSTSLSLVCPSYFHQANFIKY